jgi:hypothetical protein
VLRSGRCGPNVRSLAEWMENDLGSDFARGLLISQPTASSHLTKPFDVLPALAVSRYLIFHSIIVFLAMLTQWSQWTTCSEECDTRLGVTVRERACEHGMIGEDGCDESAYQSQFCNQDKPCRKSTNHIITLNFISASWGAWSSWTACREISQSIFAHSRTRNCENGALGSRECPVDGSEQEAPCDSEFCAQTNVGTR